ncbi:hypothetical protein ACFQX6_02890 [Streptosporangium lutulentum]
MTVPSVVMRPIWLALVSVNHSAPSGPAVIPNGPDSGVGREKEPMSPPVVIRPISWFRYWVNHSASSGPAVMIVGPDAAQAGTR